MLYCVVLGYVLPLIAAAWDRIPAMGDLGGLILGICFWLLLWIPFTFRDALWGRSPGKFLFGLQVVDSVSREPIGLGQSTHRNLILIIPFLGVLTGALTMMGGQRWGDVEANTDVVWLKHKLRVPFAPPGRFCRRCGYDLTGNTSGRCPECGLDVPGQTKGATSPSVPVA